MLNRAILIGRLTKDPELRYTPNGIAVATFTLAVGRNFKKDETDFINIVCWRKTAESVAEYMTKGRLVAVDGRIQTRNYENNEGRRIFVTEVVAEDVRFLESANRSAADAHKPANNDPFAGDGKPIDISDSDLPF